MIPTEVTQEVLARLRRAEAEHTVKVLLAIESGSRAWGFPSPDSDYDVRFIYCHAQDWYLSVDVENRRDVIEYPIVDDIDINGWDIRKALKLFWKSNPGFVEWLQSPIVYLEEGPFAQEARALLPSVYSFENGIYHYRSMASTNNREFLKKPRVRLKKYFYVLRPLLCVRWIETYGTPPPLEFSELLHLINSADVKEEIEKLLEVKKAASELGDSEPIEPLNEYIDAELERQTVEPVPKAKREADFEDLNILFRRIVAAD